MSIVGKWIEKRLGGYEQQINTVDAALPLKMEDRKSVAVIGGGLAGLCAAGVLAERGLRVTLLERNSFLGGKVGSWPVEFEGGFKTRVEHGFHAFFQQYYNLRRFMDRVGITGNLKPIEDYRIVTRDSGSFGFQGINTTPILNMISLAKRGVYKMSEMVANPEARHTLALLRYDMVKTFEKFDDQSFADFADAIGLPGKMRIVFNTFSRAFFSEAHLMSMAELIKSFHFYFLSNDLGLIYDVLNDDFHDTLLEPVSRYLTDRDARILTDAPVDRIVRENGEFRINGERYDYAILATDLKAAKGIAEQSTFIREDDPDLADKLTALSVSQPYAVVRLWLDKPFGKGLPFFIFTDRIELLDSISLYHQMEESSAQWARESGGSVVELHTYAIPDGWTDAREIRDQLIRELHAYYPETEAAGILHEYTQFRDDFTAFHVGQHRVRPTYKTAVPGFGLAGDWVKVPCPAMLMEASCVSGMFSANEILTAEGLRQEPILSVPLRGLFA